MPEVPGTKQCPQIDSTSVVDIRLCTDGSGGEDDAATSFVPYKMSLPFHALFFNRVQSAEQDTASVRNSTRRRFQPAANASI